MCQINNHSNQLLSPGPTVFSLGLAYCAMRLGKTYLSYILPGNLLQCQWFQLPLMSWYFLSLSFQPRYLSKPKYSTGHITGYLHQDVRYACPFQTWMCMWLIWVSFKMEILPWLVWLSELSAGLWTTGSLVRFPIRILAWVVGQVPSRGRWEATTHWCFSPSLSPSFPLSNNK